MSVAFGHDADDHYQEPRSRFWDMRPSYAVGLFEGVVDGTNHKREHYGNSGRASAKRESA